MLASGVAVNQWELVMVRIVACAARNSAGEWLMTYRYSQFGNAVG